MRRRVGLKVASHSPSPSLTDSLSVCDMDIVSLPSSSPRSQKELPCRPTVELQLPMEPCSGNDVRSHSSPTTLHRSHDIQYDNSSSDDHVFGPEPTNSEAAGSGHSPQSSDLGMGGAEASYESSQTDILQDMRCHPFPDFLDTHTHGYQLSYELALDNMLTPFTSPTNEPMPTSYTEHVILEILTTERTYVVDLTDIVEGYIVPLEKSFQLSKADIDNIFGNLREIKDFNRSFLCTLEACDTSSERVGLCFSKKAEGFKAHYSRYCNNYPNSIKALSGIQRDGFLSRALQTCKEELKHMLPLEAYLLKPVQRVLKYSLLLEQLVKHMSTEDAGFSKVSCALNEMKSVSNHINAMKKKCEAEIQIQRLQSLIRGLEDLDLTKAGDLVLEEGLRYGGRANVPSIRGRADRHVYIFLFRKLMLITKKDDGGYQCKIHMEMKDMQLTEQVEKEPTCFQIRQVSTGNYYTLQAPSHESKVKWVKNIKMLLMESIPCLPEKAKMLIMAGFPTDFSTKRSPKSSHQERHISVSADTSPLPSKREKQNVSRQTRSSSNLSQQYRKRTRNRSRTSPSMLTEQLARASLVATLQLQPFEECVISVPDSPPQMQEGPVIQTDDKSTFTDLQTLESVNGESLIEEVNHNTQPMFSESDRLPPVDQSNPKTFHQTESDGGVFTEDEETLFNDLMHNNANTEHSSPNSASLNQADMKTLQSLLYGSQDSITEPDGVESIGTPQLPPPPQFAMVEERKDDSTIQQPVREHADHQIIPKETTRHSPEIDRSQGSSLSVSDDIVMSSALPEDKWCITQERIVSPLTESLHVPFRGNPHEELSFDEVLQSFDHYASTTGKTARTQAREQKKQRRSPSIPRKEKKKKDRKRSMTVASIDTATVIAAKEAMMFHTSPTLETPERRNSKVQQLAREYSKRIKEIQRGSLFKRFSTVREESPERTDKPDWLRELQKRTPPQNSKESETNFTPPANDVAVHAENDVVLDTKSCPARLDPEQSSMAFMRQYGPRDSPTLQHTQSESAHVCQDDGTTTNPVELPGKGRLKGWVKSIVAKYGNK